MGDFKVSGTIDFLSPPSGVVDGNDDGDAPPLRSDGGRIVNAPIIGGYIQNLKTLNVAGGTDFKGGLTVRGDAFVEGGLTVSGSVLGSGPYVDVSDRRVKTRVRSLREDNDNDNERGASNGQRRGGGRKILDKMLQLEGVINERVARGITGREKGKRAIGAGEGRIETCYWQFGGARRCFGGSDGGVLVVVVVHETMSSISAPLERLYQGVLNKY